MTCKRGRTGTVSGMLFFAARWAAEMPILRYVHILLMRSASAACLSIYCVCVIIGRTCGAIATYRSYVASDSAHLDASDWSSAIGCLPPSPIDDVIVSRQKNDCFKVGEGASAQSKGEEDRTRTMVSWKDLCSSLFVRDFPLIASVSLVWWARASSSTSHLSHGALARHHAASCARRARHERVGLLAGRRSAAAWPTFSGRDAAAQAHRARPTAAELSRLSCSATIGHRSDA